MKRKIVTLLFLDVTFASLGYVWLYYKCYMGLYYGFVGVGLMVLCGPLFLLKTYGILISGFVLELPNLIFLIVSYALVFHSHKQYLGKCSSEHGGCLVVPYVMISWIIYFFIIAYFSYFGWLYAASRELCELGCGGVIGQ